MLIEDHEASAKGLVAALRKLEPGIEVSVAPDLAAASERVRHASPYDAIICDLGLPDASGLEAPAHIRKLSPDSVIIVLTGEAGMDGALNLVRMGIQDYLPKGDTSPQSVLRAVRLARERHLRELRVRQRLYRDPLTRVLSREGFDKALAAAIGGYRRSGNACALLVIDIDDFKQINDTFGHLVGDQLLRQSADRMANALRASDDIARFGGDEFAIVLTDFNAASDVPSIASKILRCFEDPVKIDNRHHRISLSIGIATCPLHADDAQELLRRADLAMYAAKKTGKNRWALYNDALASGLKIRQPVSPRSKPGSR